MSKYERRMWFEWLIELRRVYMTMGDDDRTTVMTVDDAVAWIERELQATRAAEPTPATEAER